jgi:hypothetical protein
VLRGVPKKDTLIGMRGELMGRVKWGRGMRWHWWEEVEEVGGSVKA